MSDGMTQAPDKLMTVDGGWSTACAVWSGTWAPQVYALNLPSNVRGSRSSTELKLREMWSRFECLLRLSLRVTTVIIEDVELWSEALVSLTAAERGDLFILAKLIGGYCNCCFAEDVDFELVQAKTWKGQLTKAATRKRVDRFWRGIGCDVDPDTPYSSHGYDAIGIGLWKVGVF